MAVSGQGLLYNFEAEGMEYEKPEEYAKMAEDKAVAKAAGDSQDVYLTIINGVLGAKKHMKWDNGALQVCALCHIRVQAQLQAGCTITWMLLA